MFTVDIRRLWPRSHTRGGRLPIVGDMGPAIGLMARDRARRPVAPAPPA